MCACEMFVLNALNILCFAGGKQTYYLPKSCFSLHDCPSPSSLFPFNLVLSLASVD